MSDRNHDPSSVRYGCPEAPGLTPDDRKHIQHAYRLLLLADDCLAAGRPRSAEQQTKGALRILEGILG